MLRRRCPPAARATAHPVVPVRFDRASGHAPITWLLWSVTSTATAAAAAAVEPAACTTQPGTSFDDPAG